jgi:hypothetical protein
MLHNLTYTCKIITKRERHQLFDRKSISNVLVSRSYELKILRINYRQILKTKHAKELFSSLCTENGSIMTLTSVRLPKIVHGCFTFNEDTLETTDQSENETNLTAEFSIIQSKFHTIY